MTRVNRNKASPYFNWWMAASNCVFMWPLWIAYINRQGLFPPLIVLSAGSSAFYHFHESQKHNLSGGMRTSLFASKTWNNILINIDRVAAVLLAAYSLFDVYQRNQVKKFFLAASVPILIALFVMSISETVYRHETRNYAIYHTLWHFLAALVLSIALRPQDW
jgi:hypothetical protein